MQTNNNILEGLSEPQREGVLHLSSPLMLLAGAGSGKTLVITKKIAYLIKEIGIEPENILAVTFTNKAANEMKSRICSMLPDIKPRRLWVKTFHAACLLILKGDARHIGYRENFTVIDEQDKISIIKRVVKNSEFELGRNITARSISKYISYRKNNAIEIANGTLPKKPEASKEDVYIYESVFDEYRNLAMKDNVMDFDDLLINTIKLFETNRPVLNYYRNRWKYILVDEFQDTNRIQYHLIRLLTEGNDNMLSVVGDDDQSIYAFRGAVVTNILNFKDDYPDTRIIKLEENYRCPKDVVSIASHIIKQNQNRLDKNVFSSKANEHKVALWKCTSDRDEAASVASEIESLFDKGFNAKDIVILYRTNSQSRIYENELISHKIPYRIVGGVGFFERAEIKDAIAFLRLLTSLSDNNSLRRVINVPPRSIGEKSLSLLEEFAFEKNISLYEAIDFIGESKITKKARASIIDFKKTICFYSNKIAEFFKNKAVGLDIQETLEDIFNNFLITINYFSIYKSEEPYREINAVENIKELFRAYYDYLANDDEATLATFLDEVVLTRNNDDESLDFITLMTVHNAKGLEYDVVFLTGLEMGIFPHFFALEDENGIDEERRLCYVGITRARRRLYISYSERRRGAMGMDYRKPSVFLKDIPKALLDIKKIDIYSSKHYEDIDEDAFDY